MERFRFHEYGRGNLKTDKYSTIIWKDVVLSDGVNEVVVKTAHGDDSAVWNVKKRFYLDLVGQAFLPSGQNENRGDTLTAITPFLFR